MMASALLALAALASAGSSSRPASAVVDVNKLNKSPVKFQSGYEYIFDYDGQVASGLSEQNSDDNEPEKAQMAMTRIHAQAKIHFVSEKRAHLQLAKVRVADANGKHVADAKRVQPLAGFESQPLAGENREHIEAPVAFDYVDGVVAGVQFAAGEPTWARNAKRAVLNLLQVNLRAANNWSELSSDEEQSQSQEKGRTFAKSYVVPEMSIEGDCLTTYTINNAVPTTESELQEQKSGLNVTKSIDFKRCEQIADVAFGFNSHDSQSGKCMRKSKSQKNAQQAENVADGPADFFPTVDDESCDPKEVNEDFVKRSTVSRIELAFPAGSSESSLKHACIRRAETLSHYSLRNAFDAEHKAEMHTIAVSRLLYRGRRAASSASDSAVSAPRHMESEIESLMYDNSEEADRKRFFMLGDKAEKTDGKFKTDENKAKHAIAILRKLIEATVEKRAGVEGADATEIQQLINILRICSVSDLQTIYKEVVEKSQRADEKRVQELLADAFAAAGTRNTIHLLVKNIHEKRITPEQAVKSLRNLHNMPASSDEIASELLALVESEQAQRSPALRQASMLTFGAVVGKMCQGKISIKSYQQEQTQVSGKSQHNKHGKQQKELAVFGSQTGFNNQKKKNNNKRHNSEDELACSPQKKQAYKQSLMHQFQRASSVYEKVLALKTIGNAGLDTTVIDLEAIILGQPSRGEQPIVRAAAVNALRRLRKQMPHKIQRITLAAYQNAKMPQHTRSAALRMLMSTQPPSHILDQMLYTLAKERNHPLLNVAYTIAHAYAKSPLPENREMGQHLKNALKLTGVSKKQLNGASMNVQIPLFSEHHGHGAVVQLMSVFSDANAMPIHFSTSVDEIVGGKQHHDMFRIAATQQGMSHVLEQAVEAMLSGAEDAYKTPTTRANRAAASAEQSTFDKLRNIFSQLSIKTRKSQPHNFKNGNNNVDAFAMLTMRFADIDHAILPLDADDVKAAVAYATSQGLLWQGSSATLGFRSLSLTSVAEKCAYIPTSAGVPMKIASAMPVLVCAEAQASKKDNAKVEIKGHLILTGMHTQKMGVESPLTGGAGVESARVVELNLPLNARAEMERDQNGQPIAKLIISVPQQKTRLFGAHTIAHTYIRESHKASEIPARHTRFIRNPASQQANVQEIDAVIGERSLGIPIRVVGHYNMPQHCCDPASWLQLAMSSENHIHITLQPTQQTPQQIVLQAEGALFQRSPAAQLGGALSKLNKIYENYGEEFYAPNTNNDDTSTTYIKEQREKLAKIVAKFNKEQPADDDHKNKGELAVYKHTAKLTLKTRGGAARDAFAHLIVDATTDARLQAWSVAFRVQRSPIYAHESGVWRADANAQMLFPETVGSSAALSRLGQQKQQKFLAIVQTTWGSNGQQFINLRVEGKQAQLNNNKQENNNGYELATTENKEESRRVRFINQFSVASDYKLELSTQQFFARAFGLLKASQYWNLKQLMQNGLARDGQTFVRVQIEPKSANKACLEVSTPTECVRINNIWLPYSIRPMPLIRMNAPYSAHSVAQMFSRFMRHAVHAECSTNGHAVQTFDGARLHGPVASSCYSVLAKDCSNKDKPQFSVLMKSLSSDGQQKKIKVIVPEKEIICQAQSINGYDTFDGNKIVCSINGKQVRGQHSRVPSWGKSSSSEEHHPFKSAQTSPMVEFDDEDRSAVTITAPSGILSVRFLVQGEEGKQQTVRVHLSGAYKHTQCGLCGHFDNDSENEWRTADDKDSSKNPMAYHRSYTMSGFESEDNEKASICTEENKNKFYNENKDKFAFHKRQTKNINTNGIWSNENEDEGFFENTPKSNWNDDKEKREYYKLSKHLSSNVFDNTFEPELKTKVIDHHHQMCFSKDPIHQCPEGSSPFDPTTNEKKPQQKQSDELNQDLSEPWNTGKAVTIKTSYVCVPRHEAGRLIRSASAGNTRQIAELLRSHQPSFTNAEPVPTACRRR